MKVVQAINHSGTFFSCHCNDSTKYNQMVRDHSLVYIYAGEVEIVDDNGEKKIIGKNECLFLRRNHRVSMVKRPANGEQFRGIFLTFPRNFLRDFYNKMEKKDILTDASKIDMSIVKIKPRPDIASLFESLIPYYDTSVQPTDEVINLKEQEGIYALLKTDERFYSVLFDFTEPWKIDIMEFLHENYMYELSLEKIASFTGRSLATFKRDFKKISNLPPQKWLIQRRLEAAYDKLQSDKKKASDIYVEVGFKNLSHFYTAFKKQYGFSPKK